MSLRCLFSFLLSESFNFPWRQKSTKETSSVGLSQLFILALLLSQEGVLVIDMNHSIQLFVEASSTVTTDNLVFAAFNSFLYERFVVLLNHVF